MDVGHFYYLDNQYYIDFPDSLLMQNKAMVNGQPHNRPCFCAFEDKTTGLHWMIPISHEVSKYQNIYNDKVQKYGYCNTIVFGDVLGYKKAFLIQNMCPVVLKYISCEYIDKKSNTPVRVNGAFEKKLIKTAKKVLNLQRAGVRLIFPDVLRIESELLKQNN